MSRVNLTLLAVALAVAAPDVALGAEVSEALRRAREELAREREVSAKEEEVIERERADLLARLTTLRTDLAKADADLRESREGSRRAAAERERLAGDAERWDAFRRGARDLLATRQRTDGARRAASLATVGRPGGATTAGGEAEPTVATCAETLLSELADGGVVTAVQTRLAGDDGAEREVTVARVGEIAAYARDAAGDVYVVARDDTGARWRLRADLLGGGDRSALGAFFAPPAEGKSWALAPLDVTGGLAYARRQAGRTFWETMRAGGPVMVPLGLVALAALVVAAGRARALLGMERRLAPFTTRLNADLAAGRWEEALAFCRASPRAPLAGAVAAGLAARGGGRAALDAAMEEALRGEAPALERGLSALTVFAAVAPLLGLLGTVTGLVRAFQVIQAKAVGANPVSPADLAGGVWEALITTVAGLVVAIPTILAYNYFVSRLT
ncbi:MAG: MotA/TolQ/ExbB proton channel family protein, partial [Planctomycetes bacterium]|nr:MotA/TolQ/ExbB proton channel family protein [Planctomycetota bacterium]